MRVNELGNENEKIAAENKTIYSSFFAILYRRNINKLMSGE